MLQNEVTRIVRNKAASALTTPTATIGENMNRNRTQPNYVNAFTDNSYWSGWVLVKENATNGTFYELPPSNQTRYRRWKLVLRTSNAPATPEISSVTFGASLIDGNHNTTVYANDTTGNENSSITHFTVDAVTPTITWDTPADGNSSIVGGGFSQNITVHDTNLYMLNCTIYNDSEMTNPVWSFQINLTGNTTYIKTEYVNVSTWPDRTYYENCAITDRS